MRNKKVPASYRVALGQLKRYYGDSNPTKKDFTKTTAMISKKNKLDDPEFFMKWAETQVPFSIKEVDEESQEYKDFVKQMVKKKGYESFDDIPKDKLDDFWNAVDKEWNSDSEPGKDGKVDEKYYTIPNDIIGNELFVFQRDIGKLYSSVKNGNDLDMKNWDRLSKMFNKIEKSIIENK